MRCTVDRLRSTDLYERTASKYERRRFDTETHISGTRPRRSEARDKCSPVPDCNGLPAAIESFLITFEHGGNRTTRALSIAISAYTAVDTLRTTIRVRWSWRGTGRAFRATRDLDCHRLLRPQRSMGHPSSFP